METGVSPCDFLETQWSNLWNDLMGLTGWFHVHSVLASAVVEKNKTSPGRSNIHLLVPENGAEKENPEQKVEAEKALKYV